MKSRAVILMMGFCTLLAACNGATFNETFGLSGVYNWGCNSNQSHIAESADWDQATIVTETSKDEIFQSGILNLRVNVPNVIEITNLDNQTRSFRAQTLFANSSILKVVHEGQEVAAPCLQSVAIAPQKTSEIHLVPLEIGYYDYYETYWTTPGLNLLPIIAPLEAVGVAYVN